jgi:hypothetical protein
MATWTGKPKNFSMEVYLPENHGYGDWVDVECGWKYNTTSDTFMPYTKLPGKEPMWGDILSQEGAVATLYGLAEWYNAYVGHEALDNMIAEIRKGRE